LPSRSLAKAILPITLASGVVIWVFSRVELGNLEVTIGRGAFLSPGGCVFSSGSAAENTATHAIVAASVGITLGFLIMGSRKRNSATVNSDLFRNVVDGKVV
jgi:hypothetical protein